MWQSQVENEHYSILIQLAFLVLCFEHTAQELVHLQHIYRSCYKPTLSILGSSMTMLQTHKHRQKWSKIDRNNIRFLPVTATCITSLGKYLVLHIGDNVLCNVPY